MKEKITAAAADDFEMQLASLNFEIGRFVANGGFNYIEAPNETEMLRHAKVYNERMNRKWKLSFLWLSPEVVKTVMHKEVNLVSNQVTYMFQKDSTTFVRARMSLQE